MIGPQRPRPAHCPWLQQQPEEASPEQHRGCVQLAPSDSVCYICYITVPWLHRASNKTKTHGHGHLDYGPVSPQSTAHINPLMLWSWRLKRPSPVPAQG